MKANPRILLFGALLAVSLRSSVGNLIREICSWTGSSPGADENQNPVVYKVEFRCQSGYLVWNNPNGGVRVEFKAPSVAAGAEFTVCMILEHRSVNVYEERNGRLVLVKDFKTELPKDPICFDSRQGSAIVFLEGAPSVSTNRIRFDYELEIEHDTSKNTQECAKCDLPELIDTFCHGDFAVKAEVHDRYLHEDEQHLQLDLHVHHLFHQSTNIFSKDKNLPFPSGTVAIPSKCTTLYSSHRFLMMGYIRDNLGAYVDCHVRFSFWKILQRSVNCKDKIYGGKSPEQLNITKDKNIL